MYRHEDCSRACPRRKRRAALELKLPVWSPFERTGYHCVWSGSAAMVWFWDEDKVAVPMAKHSTRGVSRPPRI